MTVHQDPSAEIAYRRERISSAFRSSPNPHRRRFAHLRRRGSARTD